MTLPGSGSISLAQVNTELLRASNHTCSLGESLVRSLAGVSSGAIGLGTLRGKTYGWVSTLTVGGQLSKVGTTYGFQNGVFGSMSSTNFGPSGTAITYLTFYINMSLVVTGNLANSGWSSIVVNGNTFNRSDATYTSGTTATEWDWSGRSNPFSGSGPTVTIIVLP